MLFVFAESACSRCAKKANWLNKLLLNSAADLPCTGTQAGST